MNFTQLKHTLPLLTKHNIVPFLWGYQGIGKTQAVRQLAKNSGFIHLHLATQEIGDLVGLLKHNPDGTVSHSRPEWFPTEGSGIVFLDELNRAAPEVIQCMFSFITDKTIHSHKLPAGWKIVAAGNYSSNDFNTTDTSDAAWMSRFCHLEFNPTIEEFAYFAESKGHDSIAAFALECPDMIEVQKREKPELNVTPDRRAWLDFVSPLEGEEMTDETRFEVYKGLVGDISAARFFAWQKNAEKSIKLKDVVVNYKKVQHKVKQANKNQETRFDILSGPLDELIVKLENEPGFLDTKKIGNLQAYILDIPLELSSQVIKKLGSMRFDLKNEFLNDEEFAQKLCG